MNRMQKGIGIKMKVGNLIRITRIAIGVPKDTIGLITSVVVAESGIKYHTVQMCGIETPRRWLEQDLEVLHEAR